MVNPWFRLWSEMANDPKWRTIARVSKQEVSRVIAVYIHMMTCASNADERGRTQGWCDEDVATALDIETQDVEVIRAAMQGRVLDGDYLTGWSKRQPLREDDNAAARAKAWREAQKNNAEKQDETQPNATERKKTLEKRREEEIREDKKEQGQELRQNASRLPKDWLPLDQEILFCKTERPDLEPSTIAERFRDYWCASPGAKGKKTDWHATWRNWVRNEKATPQARGSPYRSARDEGLAACANSIGLGSSYAGSNGEIYDVEAREIEPDRLAL